MRSVSDEISVNTGSSKIEERWAIWTTYRHINAWFDTLKEFLISHGFARLSTEEEMKETRSEIYFFEGQLDRIINLDELEISTDGTSKITGGRPATTYTSTDSSLPRGVEATNKSGYSATFIGGCTVSARLCLLTFSSKLLLGKTTIPSILSFLSIFQRLWVPMFVRRY